MEDVINVITDSCNPIFQSCEMALIYGFLITTVLSFLGTGIFKALALLNISK